MASADKAYKDEYQSARQAASHEKYESYQRYQAYRESYAARYGQARPAEKTSDSFREKESAKAKVQIQPMPQKTQQETVWGLTPQTLTKCVVLLVFIGILLLATIFFSARATEIKYSINKINRENTVLVNEISLLTIKIESSNSIESIEEYATSKLGMTYPKANQCIYVTSKTEKPKNLASRIRSKAYADVKQKTTKTKQK